MKHRASAKCTHGAVEVRDGLGADKLEALLVSEGAVRRRNSDGLTFVATGVAAVLATLNVHRFTVPCTPVTTSPQRLTSPTW